MNTQNILKNYGSFFDLKLDSSEFHDYELAKTDNDYNSEVLDFTKDIDYDSLKINGTLDGFSCVRTTITLVELDLTTIDEDYIYNNLSLTLPYDDFVSHFNTADYNYNEMILNNHIFTLIFEENTHFFKINEFNESLFIDPQFNIVDYNEIIELFDVDFIDCEETITENPCCLLPDKMGIKQWSYKFKNDGCDNLIEQRTPKGWSVEIVFNRDGYDWEEGNVFYYIGTRGSKDYKDFADNNLTFSFTDDGKIKWETIRYNVFCDDEGNLIEEYNKEEGITPELCVQDELRDFVVTITFERDRYLFDCDLENEGGINDLKIYAGKSPKITNHYVDCNNNEETEEDVPEFNENDEELSEKWVRERNSRMGTLKIYLNGKPIYKNDEFEEMIPSNRGPQPFIQSWGGNFTEFDVTNGISCFNIKQYKYYEEPLHFVYVRHNVIRLSNIFDIEFCGIDCVDDVFGLT